MIPSSYVDVSAVALVATLTLLAVFQIALAVGAPFGRFAWGGKHRILPTQLRIGSVASVAIYAVIAVVALDRAGNIDPLPELISRIGMWIIFAYFALSIVLNSKSPSGRERSAMVPASALLAVLSLLVALA